MIASELKSKKKDGKVILKFRRLAVKGLFFLT